MLACSLRRGIPKQSRCTRGRGVWQWEVKNQLGLLQRLICVHLTGPDGRSRAEERNRQVKGEMGFEANLGTRIYDEEGSLGRRAWAPHRYVVSGLVPIVFSTPAPSLLTALLPFPCSSFGLYRLRIPASFDFVRPLSQLSYFRKTCCFTRWQPSLSAAVSPKPAISPSSTK